MPAERISDHLKRAVIASEDSGFPDHDGVDWQAMEKAWEKNEQAAARAATRPNAKPAKIVGGSTITQQLAKNLFLSGERTLLRKGQEFVLTLMLEALLDKRRILEIYLNSVEWGEGVFGAEAAARHYYKKSAAQLSASRPPSARSRTVPSPSRAARCAKVCASTADGRSVKRMREDIRPKISSGVSTGAGAE